MRLVSGIIFVVLVAGLTSCSAMPPPDENADLRTEVNELRRKTAVNEIEIARLRHQLHQLEAALAGKTSVPDSMGDKTQPQNVEVMRREAADEPVRESVIPRATRQPTAGVEPPLDSGRDSIEESELEDSVVVAASEWKEEGALDPRRVETETPAPVLSPVDRGLRSLYDEAYTLYHEGEYASAEARFLDFLAQGAGNELSDNAMFWVGSTRFARGDYSGALRAYRETVETYPTQNKVPDALYKIGQCLEKVGDRTSAEDVYRELVSRFPETAAAALATTRLSNP